MSRSVTPTGRGGGGNGSHPSASGPVFVDLDDAFQSDDDEILIRTYGSASSSHPLQKGPNGRAAPTANAGNFGDSVSLGSEMEPQVAIRGVDAPSTDFKDQAVRKQSYAPSETDSELLMARTEEMYAKSAFCQAGRKWWQHPKLKENYKLVIASVVLTVVGFSLLLVGAVTLIVPDATGSHGWIFLVAGLLCFIPGIYHTVFVICALRGRSGYEFHSLPTFS